MIEAVCIKKLKDKNGNIFAYVVRDKNGVTEKVSSDSLKEAIKNKQVNVLNLKLTSDNRLIDNKEYSGNIEIENKNKPDKSKLVFFTKQNIKEIDSNTHLTFMSNSKLNIESIEAKSRVVGSKFYRLNDNLCAVQNSENTMMISNIQIALPPSCETLFFGTKFKSINFNSVFGKFAGGMRSMFFKCRAEAIDMRGLDTSNVMSMQSMFRDTVNLRELHIETLNTRKVETMKEMFSQCGVTKVDISSFDTSNCINMNAMFEACKIKELDLRHFNTSKVTDMSYMFNLCASNRIDVSSFDTRQVNDMEGMFYGLMIDKLDLRNFDTRMVEDMNGMFAACKAKSINVSSFNTSRVTDMRSLFDSCEATDIDVSNFDTHNVKDMSRMFRNCATRNINLSSFNTSKVEDTSRMFYEYDTDTLDLTSFDLRNVNNTEEMFRKCSASVIDLHGVKFNTLAIQKNMFDDNNISKVRATDINLLKLTLKTKELNNNCYYTNHY